MTLVKISQLPPATSPGSPADVMPVVQNGITKKAAVSSLGYVASGANATTRTIQDKLRDIVSVKDFGAVGNGVVDDASAIQAALNSGAKRVYAPAGTYKILSTLTIPTNVSLEGDGIGATIFDGSSASYATLTNGTHIISAPGTLTQIQGLSSNATIGSRSIVLTGAPTLSVNDIILIYNPTNGSWCPVNPEYRAGEWARVASVSSSTVNLQGGLADSYTTAAVNIYRLDNPSSCSLRNFTLKGLKDIANPIFGIKLDKAVDSCFENVRVWNCSYSQIYVSQCFNVQLRGCSTEEDFAASFGGDYGLSIGNSQNINVVGGYFAAARHSITVGGGDFLGSVTNRYIVIDGASLNTSGSIAAADFHENAEYSGYYNCVINSGITVGGNFISVKNNIFKGSDPTQRVPIYCTSLRGATINIEGNTVWNNNPNASSNFPLFVYFAYVNGTMVVGGTTTIKNNSFTWQGTTNNGNDAILLISNTTISDRISIDIQNNTFASTSSVRIPNSIVVRKSASTALPFENIFISGNAGNCGGISLFDSGATLTTAIADDVVVTNNDLSFGSTTAMFFINISNSVRVTGNTLTDFLGFGIITGNQAITSIKTKYSEISNNTIVNCLSTPTSSSLTDTGAALYNASYGVLKDNFSANFYQFVVVNSVSGFQLGDTITGGTSGATGVINQIVVASKRLGIGASLTGGPFVIGETITASPSGATTTITTANAYAVDKSVTLNDVTTAYVARNVDARNLPVSRNSVTGYMRGSEWEIQASTYDPPNLADGDGATQNMNATSGVSIGDIVLPTFSKDLQGITLTGYVSAADTPTVRFQNETGGTIDLASGTLTGKVIKA
jgi:hypothetical protein